MAKKRIWLRFKTFWDFEGERHEGLPIRAKNKREALKMAISLYDGKVWVMEVKK